MSSVDFPPDRREVFAPGGVTGTNAATVQVPDPNLWYIASVAFRVTTDATVQTRTPVIQILDGTGVAIGGSAAGYGAAAGTTVDYLFSAGLAEWDQANNAFASGPAPSMPLGPGDSITISLQNAAAADTITRIRVALAPLNLAGR